VMRFGEHSMQLPRKTTCRTRLSSPPYASRLRTTAPLFEPDVVLPEQFQHRSVLTPEQRLMFAVLDDAVACFRKCAFVPHRRARRLFAEVHEWIYSGDGDWPFSFENICAVLEIDSEYLRSGLERWQHLRAAT
jgi:hypothetical protein